MSTAQSSGAKQLIAEADAAARSGNIAQARSLMEQVVAVAPSLDAWMRLGSLYRAGGQLKQALSAIDNALSYAPLDFFALLGRATVLEKLEDVESGEAFGRALAQRPQGSLPPTVEQAIMHAEARFKDWNEGRRRALDAALQDAHLTISEYEGRRISRFKTNALRETKVWHSEPTHFHYPGLVEREFHDRSDFDWLSELEHLTPQIRAEFEALAQAERKELVPYVQYAAHEPLNQWVELNNSSKWLALHLIQNGRIIEATAKHCPTTMAFLQRIGQPEIEGCSPNAMFSLLAPDTTIPPHHGITNTRLVCHLPLIVPPMCKFRVGAETRKWEVGQAFVFDDTIEHEASNLSDQLRVVLIFDVWHPQLSTAERAAVKALIEVDAAGAVLAL